ncbi:MAG: GNAT family N-acetyltransferase [Hyphomicrobiaceae bacterium]
MLALERLPPEDIDWQALDDFDDRQFSQRRHWLDFIAAFTGGEVVVAEVSDTGQAVGYFSGVLFKKFGIPILGSPFRGWTTPYLGFNLQPDVSRVAAMQALETFAFRKLGAWHLELTDRHLTHDQGIELGFVPRTYEGYVTDLGRSEDDIFSGMTSACRRAIRKSIKENVVVEEADPEGFAVEYYKQLEEVFAKQEMTPTYSLDRVKKLIEFTHPSGDLLLARVKDRAGLCIATGIYPGFGQMALFWGNGSLRQHQNVRPNEALHWFAMRHWKARGVTQFDWGGAASYKAKYGVQEFTVPAFRKSRTKSIQYARDLAERAYYFPRWIKRRRHVKRIGVPDVVEPGGVR